MIFLNIINIRIFKIYFALLSIIFLIPNGGIAQGINDNPYSNINTDQLNVIEAIGFDERFIQKMMELNLSFQASLIYNKGIIADKINLETRLTIWEVNYQKLN